MMRVSLDFWTIIRNVAYATGKHIGPFLEEHLESVVAQLRAAISKSSGSLVNLTMLDRQASKLTMQPVETSIVITEDDIGTV